MPRLEPRPFGNLLFSQDNPYRRLVDRGRRLNALTARVRALLPPPQRDHCRVANVKDGELVVAVEGPAWAARVRFHTPQLLADLRRQGVPLRRVRVVVSPTPTSLPPGPATPARSLSQDSAQLLEHAADAINDEKLSVALRRLSQRSTKSR